jgi:hypothetical protein
MNSAIWIVATLLFGSTQPSLDSPKVLTSERVHFPNSGNATVTAIAKQGGLPHLIFRSPNGTQVLLKSSVGSGPEWESSIDKANPNWVDEKVRFIVLHRPGLPDPLVVALAMSPGGSDCRYHLALFGEVQGNVAPLTPDLPDHLTRGGDLLAKNAKGNWTLTVYSERYQTNDIHVNGPSRMAVFSYAYDKSLGKFIEISRGEVRDCELSENDPDLVRLFGDFAQC